MSILINRNKNYLRELKRSPPVQITEKVQSVKSQRGVKEFERGVAVFINSRPKFWQPYWAKVEANFRFYNKSERPVVDNLSKRVGRGYVHSQAAPRAIDILRHIEQVRDSIHRQQSQFKIKA